jgi:uncharacterized protein YbjT (DUF2867 family)
MDRPLRAIVQGATGAVGSEVVRACLADARFERVHAVSRRALGFTDPRLEVTILSDFLVLSSIAESLSAVDVCFSALGTSQNEETDPARYRTVSYDYVLALARALHAKNPEARMVFVSGQGADDTGKSRVLFARVKGETERDLRALFGDRLTILRPGLIRPVRPRQRETHWLERVLVPVANLLAPVAPGLTSTTVEIAHAMMLAAIEQSSGLLENHAIRESAARFSPVALG